MEELKDQVAIVTGASRGIGRVTALALARAGASVVCTARSTAGTPAKMPGNIEEAADAVRAEGGQALAVRCDISREDEVDALIERTLAEFGRIDLLVNNAAVNAAAPFSATTVKRWDLILNVNLRGTFLCTRAVLPGMLRHGSGRIVNVSSGAAADGQMAADYRVIPYAVAKAGIEALTRGLGAELRPQRIPVNCLRIETAVATEGAALMNPDVDLSGWERPEAVAEAIVWLATRNAAYTGNVLTVGEVRALLHGGAD